MSAKPRHKHYFRCHYFFDGKDIFEDIFICVENGKFEKIAPYNTINKKDFQEQIEAVYLLSPLFTDLQVNGLGGVQFNNDPSLECLQIMAETQIKLGTYYFLPTLITDSTTVLKQACEAVVQFQNENGKHSNIIGLHLEGPHVSIAKKGAHAPEHIRPMSQDDLIYYIKTHEEVGLLKLTIAPESVTLQQTQMLAEAGIYLSLGHTNCDYETAIAYFNAGVKGVTHLYNAMSGLSHRAPGLVGAALTHENLNIGLIADGHHIHTGALKLALSILNKQANPFLVTDAMAPLGTSLAYFELNDRIIMNEHDRLTLEDGTLAGANVALPKMVKYCQDHKIASPIDILKMVTLNPLNALGLNDQDFTLKENTAANFNIFNENWEQIDVYIKGKRYN